MKKVLIYFILSIGLTAYGGNLSNNSGDLFSLITNNQGEQIWSNHTKYLYQDDAIIFKGNVNKNGSVLFCKMIIFEKSSLAVVFNDNVCRSGSDFEIIIPKGTYNIYIRDNNPGELPVEFENIQLRQDTSIYFNYDPSYAPPEIQAKIRSVHSTKIFLLSSNDSLRLECEITEKNFLIQYFVLMNPIIFLVKDVH